MRIARTPLSFVGMSRADRADNELVEAQFGGTGIRVVDVIGRAAMRVGGGFSGREWVR